MKGSWLVASLLFVIMLGQAPGTPGLASQFVFTGDSYFYGPAVTEPASNVTVNAAPGSTYSVMVQNQVGLRYWIDPELSISGVFDFAYHADVGMALSSDSFLKLYKSALWSEQWGDGDFALDADSRVYVPTSEFSQENHIWGSVRTGLNPSYAIHHSPVSFSMANFVRYWPNFSQVELYTGPQMNYRINDQFLCWLLYERLVTINDQSTYSAADFEPGVEIIVGEGISLTPYLNWYTSQPLETTSFNLSTSIAL